MPEPRDIHSHEQREAQAVSYARLSAAYYKTLRKEGIPATPASAMAEAYVAALLAGDLPPEPWQG